MSRGNKPLQNRGGYAADSWQEKVRADECPLWDGRAGGIAEVMLRNGPCVMGNAESDCEEKAKGYLEVCAKGCCRPEWGGKGFARWTCAKVLICTAPCHNTFRTKTILQLILPVWQHDTESPIQTGVGQN